MSKVICIVYEDLSIYNNCYKLLLLLFYFQALLSCPTSSISTEKPAHDILEVQKTFPIPIDIERIPVI